MKPLGQKPLRFPGKTDCHPPKGFVNWWESECGNGANVAAFRQSERKEIEDGLKEYLECNDK